VGWSISCSVSNRIDRLHHFVFTSSLFDHWIDGTLATTSLASVGVLDWQPTKGSTRSR
jgi:hypothetical protein